MSNENQNPERNDLSDAKKKKAALLVTGYMEQLAIGLGTIVPKERQVLYLVALEGLNPNQIEYGFKLALKKFVPGYGIDYPAPAMLLEWCEEWRPEESNQVLKRADKPPDWAGMAKRSGVTQEEIQEWLQGGKDAQLELQARQHADPEWNAMARRLGAFPGLSPRVSAIPADSEARKVYMREKLKENGWL